MPIWGHQVKILDDERPQRRCDWRFFSKSDRCPLNATRELSYCSQVPGQSKSYRTVHSYCWSHFQEVCQAARVPEEMWR